MKASSSQWGKPFFHTHFIVCTPNVWQQPRRLCLQIAPWGLSLHRQTPMEPQGALGSRGGPTATAVPLCDPLRWRTAAGQCRREGLRGGASPSPAARSPSAWSLPTRTPAPAACNARTWEDGGVRPLRKTSVRPRPSPSPSPVPPPCRSRTGPGPTAPDRLGPPLTRARRIPPEPAPGAQPGHSRSRHR